MPGPGGAAEETREQEAGKKEQVPAPSLSLAASLYCPVGRAKHEAAGKAAMCFAQSQFQHHKAGYRELGLELRDLNLTNGPLTVRIK